MLLADRKGKAEEKIIAVDPFRLATELVVLLRGVPGPSDRGARFAGVEHHGAVPPFHSAALGKKMFVDHSPTTKVAAVKSRPRRGGRLGGWLSDWLGSRLSGWLSLDRSRRRAGAKERKQ